MRKMILTAMFGLFQMSVFAETNALIEVKLFKDWVIKGEGYSGGNLNLAIKNTGTVPIRLFKHPANFDMGQLDLRPLPRRLNTAEETGRQEFGYQAAVRNGLGGFFDLPPGEAHVYEGRKFLKPLPFVRKMMRFTVSVYLGDGFWLDSEPMTLNEVVPDSEEHIATITDGTTRRQYELLAVTYKNERWLYIRDGGDFPICPISLTNKIRVEPYDGKLLHKIWDGEKSMVFHLGQDLFFEDPDESDVFGKWTRERKQRAEADNAEVRRKKAEGN